MASRRLGIVVGGGPAPGINAVIGAATIEAINRGFEVIGIYDGFSNLITDEFDPSQHAVKLMIPMVARIHFEGGSILRTARTNLLDNTRLKASTKVEPDPNKVSRVLANFEKMGIDSLLTIGGDDTSLSARFSCDAAQGKLTVVHCPKTIDNDLPLPYGVATFGFHTAMNVGTQVVKNLMRDSQTTNRWYFVEAMGRTAGSLAISIAQAAGATVAMIPEEFPDKCSVANMGDVIEGSILKRRAQGRPDGVAVVAEGVAYRLGDVKGLEELLGHEVPLDAAGHPRLAEVPLADMLKREVKRRFEERGDSITIVSHQLGYELRCADPTPYDMRYCRALGWGAVQMLLEQSKAGTGRMVTIVNDNLVPMDFHEIVNPDTNRTQVRVVDIDSDNYRVARAYQIRLEESDLANEENLGRLAGQAQTTPDAFRAKFTRAATPLSKMSDEMKRPQK